MDDGVVPIAVTPFQFAGAPTDLMAAMEKAFVLQKPSKKKHVGPRKVVLPPKGKVVKVVVPKKTLAATTTTAQPPTAKKSSNARPTIASGGVATNFDRNRDGATDAELERAAHLITNVTKVDSATRQKYAQALQSITQDFTQFLLMEVAPYESALDAALDDAADMVRIITGTQSASFNLGRADTLLRRLPELKTLDWVCKRFAVPADIRELVINEYMGTNNERKAKAGQDNSNNGSGQLQAHLSELLKLSRMQRRAEGPQSPLRRPQARPKR